MENLELFTFIVGKDERREPIRINFYVNELREVNSINFAGIIFEEKEIQKMNVPKMDINLYEELKKSKSKTLDITDDFYKKTPEEIIEIIKNEMIKK